MVKMSDRLFYALFFWAFIILLYVAPIFAYAQDSGFGGGGAGGSWGEPVAPVCKNGTVGTTGWYRSPGTNGIYYSTPSQACQAVASYYKQTYLSVDSITSSTATCRMQGDQWSISYANNCTCPTGTHFNDTMQQCIKDIPDCPVGSTWDGTMCKADPIACPAGQHLDTATNTCVDDPPPPCDSAVQECNPDGTPKCDCCEKLDTIIGNQSKQIEQASKTNQSLSSILAQQQTTNLKIDLTNQKLDAIAKAIADSKVDIVPLKQSIDNILSNDKTQADKVNAKLDELLNAIKSNKYDDTALQALIKKQTDEMLYFLKTIASSVASTPVPTSAPTPASATDVTAIMENQDEQTDLLTQIRDLFKEDKENPVTPPEPTPEQAQAPTLDPFASIKAFDISQNRINAQAQCPADISFTIMGRSFSFPMTWFCQFFALLAPVFVSLAYFKGAMIIVKAGE